MRNGRRHNVAVSVGGMLGGVLGTAAIRKATGITQKLPEPLHMPPMTSDPGQFVVGKVEELRGGPLAPVTHARAAKVAPWIYGLAWAAGLAAVARPLRMHRVANALLAGASLGGATWTAGYVGWLPAAGITKPVTREHPVHLLTSLAAHVLYGILVAAPIFVVERQFTRRRSLRRRLFGLL
jgi:hypothetical protein